MYFEEVGGRQHLPESFWICTYECVFDGVNNTEVFGVDDDVNVLEHETHEYIYKNFAFVDHLTSVYLLYSVLSGT